MRDLNQPRPIHPANCTCPRCDPQLLRGRQRSSLEIGICTLIIAAAFFAAGFAIFVTP